MTTYRKIGNSFQRLSACGFVWQETSLDKLDIMFKVSQNNATVVDEQGKLIDLFK